MNTFWNSYEATGKWSGGVQGAMVLFKRDVHEAVKNKQPFWQAIHGGLTSLTGFTASILAGIPDLIVQAHQEAPFAPDVLWPLTAAALAIDGAINNAHYVYNDVSDLASNGFSAKEADVFTKTTRVSGDALTAGALAYSAWSLAKPITITSVPGDLQIPPPPLSPAPVVAAIPASAISVSVNGGALLQSGVTLMAARGGSREDKFGEAVVRTAEMVLSLLSEEELAQLVVYVKQGGKIQKVLTDANEHQMLKKLDPLIKKETGRWHTPEIILSYLAFNTLP